MAENTQRQFQNVLSKMEQDTKKGITKEQMYTAASVAPITGDAIAIKELPDDIKQIKTLFEEGYRESDFKKIGMGALYATAVTAGIIPVAGIVGRTAKSFLKPVIKKASDEMSSIFKTASGNTNMTPALAGDAPTINKSVTSKEPTSSTVLKKDDYEGQKVFHSTANDFKEFGFVSKNDGADIGFHVGTPVQAQKRTTSKSGERTLPLQLRTTLKPARIPDLSSFKEPRNWLAQISVNGNDKDLLRFLMQDPKDAKLILDQVENKLPIKMNGTTYYMLPDAERMGMDKKLWKDLVLESGRAVKKLNTTTSYRDRQEWFETIKKVANKNGYDSYVYKNEFEVGSASNDDLVKQIKEVGDGKRDPSTIDLGKQEDSYMLLEEDQAKGVFGTKTKGNPDFMKNKGGLLLAKGGTTMNMNNQMEMFEEGGLKDEGGTIDPVSGNDVPSGSTQEEVRDDIPAQLSEGEFVFPADVTRFIGLEKLMQMRQKAKMGLQKMEDMGQMGNSDEATISDNLPFDINDLDTEEEEQYNSETTEMAKGGVIKAATGTLVNTTPNIFSQQSQFANQQLPTTNTYTAPTIPTPTIAPVGGYTPQFSGQTGQSGQTVIPTFQNLIGNTDGRYDELREYRSESGMILKIPFVNGEPIYPIPEGYTYVDPEEVVEEAPVVQSKTPTTTRVAEQDDGQSGYDERQKKEDEYGIGQVNFFGGEVKDGKVTGTTDYGITFGYTDPTTAQKYGGAGAMAGMIANPALGFFTAGVKSVKDNMRRMSGEMFNKEVAMFTKDGVSVVIPHTIANNLFKDRYGKDNKNLAIIDNLIAEKSIIVTSLMERNKRLTKRDANKMADEVIRTSPYQKGSKRARENAAVVADNVSKYGSDYWSNLEKENQEKRDNFVGPTQTVPGRPNVIGQDYGIGAGTSVVGGTFTGGDDSAPGGNAGSTGNTGQDTYGGGFSQDDWNKGGLLGKKKTPKPKKMKRGGLASR